MNFNEKQAKEIYEFIMKYNSEEKFKNNSQNLYDKEISKLSILHIYALEEILRYGTKGDLIMKIFYFLPFIIGCFIYIFLGIASSFRSISYLVWIALVMLFTSGILMNKNKWWGMYLGIIIGLLLIYVGTKETGQIIKETPFGIIICIYYIVCGIISYKNLYRKLKT